MGKLIRSYGQPSHEALFFLHVAEFGSGGLRNNNIIRMMFYEFRSDSSFRDRLEENMERRD